MTQPAVLIIEDKAFRGFARGLLRPLLWPVSHTLSQTKQTLKCSPLISLADGAPAALPPDPLPASPHLPRAPAPGQLSHFFLRLSIFLWSGPGVVWQGRGSQHQQLRHGAEEHLQPPTAQVMGWWCGGVTGGLSGPMDVVCWFKDVVFLTHSCRTCQ